MIISIGPPPSIEEQRLREEIKRMQEKHRLELKPLVDQLVEIENKKSPRMIAIMGDQSTIDWLKG